MTCSLLCNYQIQADEKFIVLCSILFHPSANQWPPLYNAKTLQRRTQEGPWLEIAISSTDPASGSFCLCRGVLGVTGTCAASALSVLIKLSQRMKFKRSARSRTISHVDPTTKTKKPWTVHRNNLCSVKSSTQMLLRESQYVRQFVAGSFVCLSVCSHT